MRLSQGTNCKAGRCLLSTAMPADLPQTFIKHTFIVHTDGSSRQASFIPTWPNTGQDADNGWCAARQTFQGSRHHLSTPSGPPPPGFCPQAHLQELRHPQRFSYKSRVPTQLAHAKIKPRPCQEAGTTITDPPTPAGESSSSHVLRALVC